MPRILYVWLPSWPTQRLSGSSDAPARATSGRNGSVRPDGVARASRSSPRATVEGVRGVRRLAAVCPLAAAAGLAPGQPLAEARALCPELDALDADPAADHAALAALAAWAGRYTPLAAADPPEGLLLNIAGCDHLFGGEEALAAHLAARLERRGFAQRIAIAGTLGAAWALARATGGAPGRLPPGGEAAALAPLPLALLRLDSGTVAALRRIGLRSIGELARQPRADIAARFGETPLRRLDQALGARTEPVAWPRPAPEWESRLGFAEPIGTPTDLAACLERLAADLCAQLEAARLGAHRFAATFWRADGARPELAIATALPVRDSVHVARLLREKLPGLDPGFGIDTAVLAAEDTAPLAPDQSGLDRAAAAPPLAATLDALANRLGPGRLWRPAPGESHVPERAVRRLPPLARAPSWEHDPAALRPIRLLRRPEPIEVTALLPDDPPILFRWRGALHRVRAATGPERIGAEWWRCNPEPERPESDLLRDYYRVEDTEGARFWVFRVGLEAAPRWFLHGLFG